MSVSYFTSTTLINDVQRRALIPQNQLTFTSDDFLALANDEIKIGLVPSVLSYHEEYLVYYKIFQLNANQSRYTIPYRAIGMRLRDLFYQDIQGNMREMSRVSADDKAFYQTVTLENRFVYFYIENNDVVILPQVGATPTGSVIMYFFMRPNELVDLSRVGTIQNYVSDPIALTTTFTLDQVPTGFSTTSLLDVMQTQPGHKTRFYDLKPTNVNTTNKTVTFNTSDILPVQPGIVTNPTTIDIVNGDYISFSGECIIPQLPPELHTVLSQRVACRCLEALGDQQGLQSANVKLQEMEIKTGTLIDNRIEGAPKKINNIRGILRNSKVRRRGWI